MAPAISRPSPSDRQTFLWFGRIAQQSGSKGCLSIAEKNRAEVSSITICFAGAP